MEKIGAHKRWHPLLKKWVVVANQTQNRPWSGAKAGSEIATEPTFDPNCYLCPGVKRASGIINPVYTAPYSFVNDFAALNFCPPQLPESKSPLEIAQSSQGICKVICYHPQHNIGLSQMTIPELISVIQLWQNEFQALSSHNGIEYIMIFENKGSVVGVSNPHPHGQIYASDFIPEVVDRYEHAYREHHEKTGKCIVCELITHQSDRIIDENIHFQSFVPFFAQWPFEMMVVSKNHVNNISELLDEQVTDLASILQLTLRRYDHLFNQIMPNIMIQYNAPLHTKFKQLHHFHISFFPPLRQADRQKFLAGFEAGGGNIVNPVLPEYAAKLLLNAG